MASPDTAQATQAAPPVHGCASCGAAVADDQRYCLNCGRPLQRRDDLLQALAPRPAVAPAFEPPPPPPAPPGPRMLSPLGVGAVAALLLLAGITGALVAGDDPQPAPQIRVAAAPQPNVNVTVPAAAAAAPAAEAATFTSDWSGEDGWTIELSTLAKDGTQPAQVATAKADATTKGAPDVGALDSDEYPSLDPAQYVIYSGVFDTKKAATAALKDVKKDFPDATVVKVSAAAGEAPAVDKDTAKQSDEELKKLENAQGDDFVEKSKKLPSKVGTEGAAPKKDAKPAGGGSGDGTVLE